MACTHPSWTPTNDGTARHRCAICGAVGDERRYLHVESERNPVAWMHDGENRLDICHDTIKNLLIAAKCGRQVEHYTIPLYAAPGGTYGVDAASKAVDGGM